MNLKLEIMKTSIIYLIVISFLFQSCFTYRAIDLKETPLVVGKNYKIRQDTKFEISNLQVVNDSVIIVMEDTHYKNIPISKIKEIKEGKFSALKTVGLVLGIGLVVIVVAGIIEMSDFNIGNDFTIPQN